LVTRKRWRHERARAFARGAATAAAVQGERAQARSSRVCSSLAPPSITSSCSSSVAVQAGLGQLAPAPRTRELAVTPASRSSPGRAPLLGPLLLALRPPRAQQLAQPAHAHGAYLVALADRQRPVALITTPAHLARPPARPPARPLVPAPPLSTHEPLARPRPAPLAQRRSRPRTAVGKDGRRGRRRAPALDRPHASHVGGGPVVEHGSAAQACQALRVHRQAARVRPSLSPSPLSLLAARRLTLLPLQTPQPA